MEECTMNQSRRTFLKVGSAALAMIPVTVIAAKNEGLRTAMKYVDNGPEADKHCVNCLHFVPGATPDAQGGCKLFAGDTEIAPKGTCTAFAKKP